MDRCVAIGWSHFYETQPLSMDYLVGATAPGTSKYEVNFKLIKLLGRP